jgi:hypothetical protein
MPRQDLYIESSVWNCRFNDHVPELQRQTTVFFDCLKADPAVQAYLSDVVEQELGEASHERRARMTSLIEEIAPSRLELDEDAIRLAQAYIRYEVLTEAHSTDARHVAIATMAELDAVVSWNYRHLVNRRRRDAFNGVNAIMGYPPIDIVSPPEVFHD